MTDSEDPTARNRLDEASSPYLQQHADNPVNWQPWDQAALDAARERDVPIFLSIGYAACHWCHVMEDESFQDEEVAEILNEHFVPIKVDREERPDIDSIYMSICQQVTGGGGWPLSAWLTPDGKPFYVGTYFPPEPKRGMPGFQSLLTNLAETWEDPNEREKLEDRAEQWTDAITSDLETPSGEPTEPDEDVLQTAATVAHRGADRDNGGWGSGGPKFPQTGRLHALLRAHADGGDDDYLAVVEETLNAMASRGLYDHVGGGFHRYSTDPQWAVPHFEKMLYDNAEIPRVFLAGYQALGNEQYAAVVRESFEFVQRELQHPDGGFYSTLDAVSTPAADPEGESEEGAFYVWTPEQVHDAVADETAAEIFCEYFGVTDRGNFEGATVLAVRKPLETIAEEYDLTEDAVVSHLETALDEAFEARANRPRPARDEKVLAGWNGLMIRTLAEGALVLDESYAEVAADALSFVREHHWDEEANRLSRRYKDGSVGIDGYLEDYAFLGRGALALFEATGDVEYLDFALDLATAIVEVFWDEDAETLYFTPEGGESLVARPQELTDQSTPSSTGVAVELLLSLSNFRTDDQFEAVAESVVRTHANRVSSNPLEHASLTLATDVFENGSLELTLVADPTEPPIEWTQTLAERYVPRRLLAWRPDDDAFSRWLEMLDLSDEPPIWAGRGPVDGEPTVYACRHFACSPPKHELAAALEWALE